MMQRCAAEQFAGTNVLDDVCGQQPLRAHAGKLLAQHDPQCLCIDRWQAGFPAYGGVAKGRRDRVDVRLERAAHEQLVDA